MTTIRVATTQYNTGNDVQANLEKLLGFIDQAAAGGAQLVVTPEFGNHTSFYQGPDHCWEIAIDPDGDYVQAIKDRAREKSIHVVFNATCRGEVKPKAFITNFLISDEGELVGSNQKQTLMGGEAENLSAAESAGAVFDTKIGRIGMMSCLDGVPPETARNLAVLGAQLITNSHNSCALDEPYLHIPVRAAENRAWVAASGKVGTVCVPEMVGPLCDMVGIPEHLVVALGENPILDPNGDVVEQLPCNEEGIIFADIDLSRADDKSWADGDLMADRRPELYAAVTQSPAAFAPGTVEPYLGSVINVRSDRYFEENCNRAIDLLVDAADNGSRLVVLPELCTLSAQEVAKDPAAALVKSRQFEAMLAKACKAAGVYACTSLVTEVDGKLHHTGILIDDAGSRILGAHQTHLPGSYKAWAEAGNVLETVDTPLGRIGIMIGYDALFPEVATVLARQGAEVVLHPTHWEFDWEVRLAVPERAAENRITVLSAARSDGSVRRGGLINTMSVSNPLRARDLNPIWPIEAPFDRECHISATIHPERSRNKDLIGFDLQQGRRIELYNALVE
jgi:deaminated glutathione amidase